MERQVNAISLIIILVLISTNGNVIGAIEYTNQPAFTTSINMACPPLWDEWGQDCYYFSSNYTNFYEAVALCASMTNEIPNARLASIHSQAENDFILNSTMTMNSYVWIGMERSQVDQQFYWIDNTPVVFTNFYPGQPDDHNGTEDCVHMHTFTIYAGLWNDLFCSNENVCVCKGDQYGATQLPTLETATATIPGTTSSAPDTRKVPNYRISLLGNFSSSSGQLFDQNCASRYSQSMYERADSMRSPVNDQLGGQLCSERLQGELLLGSATSALTTEEDLGYVKINYFLVPLNHLTLDEVAACGFQTSNYLREHDNWGYPILVGIAGCPFPEFEPDYVNGGFVWHCANTGNRRQLDTSKLVDTVADAILPGYELELYGEFNSRDGQTISISCTSQYADDMERKVIEMIGVVNGLMESQQLCTGQTSIYVLTAGSSFFAQNTAGNTRVYYTLATRSGALRFTEMFACADQVEVFLSDHNNWGFPLLPQIPGCPYLEFNPAAFSPQEQSWYCFEDD